MKRQKGITLVALVITIVIIVILSSVTLVATFGDNGIIKKAELARDLASNSTLKEAEDMNILMDEYANIMSGGENPVPGPEEDKTPPTVEIVVGEVTETSIAITANAIDDSGEIAKYVYHINGKEPQESTTNTYKYDGLTAGTQYSIKVEAFDKANNKGENSTKASTTKPNYPTIEEKLKEGDYVTYPSAKGDLKCIVLYDNTSGYGVQLITSSCVGSDITLGKNGDFNGNKTVYNEAVGKLNEAAGKYNNSTYSTRARCVGSHPTNTSDTTTYFTSSYSYMNSYNGQFLNADENYDPDYKKMQAINGGIHNIGKTYWLASRNVDSDPHFSDFMVRIVKTSGDLSNLRLCYVHSSGNGVFSNSYSLRPVFILKSGIKVTGGDGESGTPYTLGV